MKGLGTIYGTPVVECDDDCAHGRAWEFPKHLSLTLSHNDHKNDYATVASMISADLIGYRADEWVSVEQREKAVSTDECWTLQWYPNTPIGFCVKSAADLDVLLEWVDLRKG